MNFIADVKLVITTIFFNARCKKKGSYPLQKEKKKRKKEKENLSKL